MCQSFSYGKIAVYMGAMLLVWSVLQHTRALCCLFRESCNIGGIYVACLASLAIYGASMLLVWGVLQYTSVLCCLFGQSCNIGGSYLSCLVSFDKYEVLNIACHTPLAIFSLPTLLVALHLQCSDLQHCLSHPTCNVQSSNIACRTPLAMFRLPTLLVTPHLQYSDFQHCLSHPTCNVQTHISENTKRVQNISVPDSLFNYL